MKFLIGWRFVLILMIVITIQSLLLKIIINNGFTEEEWFLLFDYKTATPSIDLLDKLYHVFNAKGIYTTNQVYYIGVLESIFKGNYQAYQITNIFFKVLATISLYPLVLVISKRKLLAFLTTILFAISYSSSGALQFVVKGSDYLAIFFMNVCLIPYFLSFKTKRRFLVHTTTILLFLSFIFSPIRIYPLLLLLILIEIIRCIKIRKLHKKIMATLRLILIFIPYLILFLLSAKSTSHYIGSPIVIFNLISLGNYHLLLTPFAGLGYTFLPNDYLSIFGQVTFDNFKDYLSFLFHGPIIIYSSLSILLGFLLTRKPLKYFLAVMFTNVVFEIVSYFLVTNLRGVTGPNVKGFIPGSINAIFLGFFVISVAVSALIIWLKNHKSNILLLSLFIGPIFSSAFLWGTWLIIGDVLTFKEGIHWYLIIPPIGSSLFLASLMILGVEKLKTLKINIFLKRALITCIFLTIIPIYSISSKEINTTFSNLLRIGYGASDQEQIKAKLLSFIKAPFDTNPALFYFETSEDSSVRSEYYPVTLLSAFEQRMHFKNWEIVNGCIGLIYNKEILKKAVTAENGIKGIRARSLCVEGFTSVERPEIFYALDNFYAFGIKNKDFTDIKKSILDDLGF